MNNEQYSVYVYYKDNEKDDRRLPKWERIGSTRSPKRALKHAWLLNQKDLYDRIEVQQKFYDTKLKTHNGSIIKTYKKNGYWKRLFSTLKEKAKT